MSSSKASRLVARASALLNRAADLNAKANEFLAAAREADAEEPAAKTSRVARAPKAERVAREAYVPAVGDFVRVVYRTESGERVVDRGTLQRLNAKTLALLDADGTTSVYERDGVKVLPARAPKAAPAKEAPPARAKKAAAKKAVPAKKAAAKPARAKKAASVDLDEDFVEDTPAPKARGRKVAAVVDHSDDFPDL